MRGNDDLRKLAAEQHGVVSRRQCRHLGVDWDTIRPEREGGLWERLSPRVLRLAGTPCTARSRVMAAVLDADEAAVASHRTAAGLWRLPGFGLGDCEVSRLHGGDYEPVLLGRVHHPRLLPSHHTAMVDGIPVTTPARTVFDLAGVVPPHRTERALDNAVAMSPGLLPALHRMLPGLARRGRTGVRLMRELLADRPVGTVVPASGLEARVIRLLDQAGIRTRRQVDLGGDDWIGRVDLVVVGTDLVIEVDSARFHTSRLDRLRDERRDAELLAAGHRVLRISEEEAWHAPDEVVRRVRSALRRAA